MTRSTTVAFVLTALTALSACPPEPEPLPAYELRSVDLRVALGESDVAPVGVTIEAESGRVFVLDEFRGLFEVLEDGTVESVLRRAEFPVPDVGLRSNFTDLVAIGPDRFALTARSDGYLLDLSEQTLTQFFCYLPDEMEDEPWLDQLTHSVTYDAPAGLLYAQPQTFEVSSDGGETMLRSSIASFDVTTGADLAWIELDDPEFIAGGIASEGDGSILLGVGAMVYRYAPDEGLREVGSLAGEGVIDIVGLVADELGDGIWALDGGTDRLIKFGFED